MLAASLALNVVLLVVFVAPHLLERLPYRTRSVIGRPLFYLGTCFDGITGLVARQVSPNCDRVDGDCLVRLAGGRWLPLYLSGRAVLRYTSNGGQPFVVVIPWRHRPAFVPGAVVTTRSCLYPVKRFVSF